MKWKTYSLCSAARSLCRLFLNQFDIYEYSLPPRKHARTQISVSFINNNLSMRIYLLALLWVPLHLPILVSLLAMDMDCVRTIHAISIVIFPVNQQPTTTTKKHIIKLANWSIARNGINYFETVAGLFAIPNCMWQWKFTSNSVFTDRSQCTTTQFFSFNVMCFQPKFL